MNKKILSLIVGLCLVVSIFFVATKHGEVSKDSEKDVSLPLAVKELENQEVQESVKQEAGEVTIKIKPTKANFALYKGAWFDIEYPQDFIVSSTGEISIYKNIKYVLADEAYFISPDGTVEFFVYSPLWSGNPETYLTVTPTEEVISEKIDKVKESERPSQYGERVVRWVTIKAKDGSYYRSFISIQEQVGTGSELHHVFGIKYKDEAAYSKYRDAYVVFKGSLQQYAD